MQIPHDLPQFKNQTGLLIVAAEHGAEFYHAHSGTIDKVAEFAVENPRYSDREGQFMTNSPGLAIRTGAVYENKKDKVRQDFTKELAAELARPEVVEGVETIYIFAPQTLKGRLEQTVPKDLAERVAGHVWGNHHGRHPLELLKHIKEQQAEGNDADEEMSAEARKILEQTD